jgi:hypothetical protein
MFSAAAVAAVVLGGALIRAALYWVEGRETADTGRAAVTPGRSLLLRRLNVAAGARIESNQSLSGARGAEV